MLIKTENFTNKLNHDFYQIKLSNRMILKGSFKNTYWISDIDYTALIKYNPDFLKLLKKKIHQLKNFIFVKINAGYLLEYISPWKIYTEGIRPPFNKEECDFDLEKSLEWIRGLKERDLLPSIIYEQIYDILNKPKLILGDLVIIDGLLENIGKIQWIKEDVLRGYKIINGIKYNFLDELKNDPAPVAKFLYAYQVPLENRIAYVTIDVGLVDNKYKKQMGPPVYHYEGNIYKILKSFKKYLPKSLEKEYWESITKLGYFNSLLAQIDLLELVLKYRILDPTTFQYLYHILYVDLGQLKIDGSRYSLPQLKIYISEILNRESEPLVKYFLPKLKGKAIIEKNQQIYKTQISQIPVSTNTLIQKRVEGIHCPFFNGLMGNYIDYLAHNVLIDKEKMSKCFVEVSKELGMKNEKELVNMFSNIPANRLIMENGEKFIKVYGDFTEEDIKGLSFYGKKDGDNIYKIPVQNINKIQIYFLTGKMI